MAASLMTGLDRRRLRLALTAFFLALAVPTAVLVQQAYGQLKWEAFHQHQALAEELVSRMDTRLNALIGIEEARSFADYAFLTVAGDPAANLLQRSALAAFPVPPLVPGLVGHFQVDVAGRLSSPLLPAPGGGELGIGASELRARAALVTRMHNVLAENRLVQADPRQQPTANAAAAREETKAAFSAAVELARRRAESSARDDEVAREPAARLEGGLLAERVQRLGKSSMEAEAESPLASEEASDSTVYASPSEALPRLALPAPVRAPALAPATPPAAESVAPQAAFDELNKALSGRRLDAGGIGRVEDLDLVAPYATSPAQQALLEAEQAAPTRTARKEKVALPETQQMPAEADGLALADVAGPLAITTFESELDPFEFSLLGSGHFVLFRKVWRDGQRYIQGLLIEQQPFLEGAIGQPFRTTTLARTSDLSVAWRGDVLAAFGGQPNRAYLYSSAELAGSLLHRARLSTPLSDFELLFSVRQLPVGPGASVILWTAAILALVLAAGFAFMYRAGCRQIDLTRQQQDFVAAVSHELKTPLTSIRMYGEMLRAGWVADESKRRGYYDYIVDESERLSRLIGNVLQLARMTRNDVEMHVTTVTAGELAERVRAKIAAQVERVGFTLDLVCEPSVESTAVLVDEDAFSQVLINLVDNALKFAAHAERREVRVEFRRESAGGVCLVVRDYGPGVPRGQMKRIFRLFYRAGNELTRETVGTGIGLALVRGLARAMGANVDVVNREPGAEFRVRLRAASAS